MYSITTTTNNGLVDKHIPSCSERDGGSLSKDRLSVCDRTRASSLVRERGQCEGEWEEGGGRDHRRRSRSQPHEYVGGMSGENPTNSEAKDLSSSGGTQPCSIPIKTHIIGMCVCVCRGWVCGCTRLYLWYVCFTWEGMYIAKSTFIVKLIPSMIMLYRPDNITYVCVQIFYQHTHTHMYVHTCVLYDNGLLMVHLLYILWSACHSRHCNHVHSTCICTMETVCILSSPECVC